MRRFSAEATAIAARLGDPQAAALAAAARRRAYWGPGHLERRLADSTQLLRAAREAERPGTHAAGRTRGWSSTCSRSATGPPWRRRWSAFEAGAEELRQPVFIWNPYVWRAMLALLDGRLAEAERLAAEALSSGIMPEGVTAPQYYAMQLLGIRREQGRMVELEGADPRAGGRQSRCAWAGAPDWPCCCARPAASDEARELMAGMAAGFAAVPPRRRLDDHLRSGGRCGRRSAGRRAGRDRL